MEENILNDTIALFINQKLIFENTNKIKLYFCLVLIFLVIKRFYKQLPLEEYFSNTKKLKSTSVDYFAKICFILLLALDLYGYYVNFKIDFSDLKTKMIFGLNLIWMSSNTTLILCVLSTPYLTWFMILRIISIIVISVFEKNLYLLGANFIIDVMIRFALKEKPWNNYMVYRLFVELSRFIFMTTITRLLFMY